MNSYNNVHKVLDLNYAIQCPWIKISSHWAGPIWSYSGNVLNLRKFSSLLPLMWGKTSSYKSHSTWKGLDWIALMVQLHSFFSLYTNCMSDVEITKYCRLIGLLKCAEVMADIDFELNKILQDRGIQVRMPPSLVQIDNWIHLKFKKTKQKHHKGYVWRDILSVIKSTSFCNQ